MVELKDYHRRFLLCKKYNKAQKSLPFLKELVNDGLTQKGISKN